MFDFKRMYLATHVTVTKPDGTKLFTEGDGLMGIVLDTGDHVWIQSNYHWDGLDPEILRVGDARSNGYDGNGNCVHSVPAAWCTFWDADEAESIEQAYEADQQLLSYAIG